MRDQPALQSLTLRLAVSIIIIPRLFSRAMHKIASSLLFLLFVHFSTWRYFVLVHADVSRRSPSSASNFLNSEANAFVPEENGIALQQQEQSLAPKTISPESTVVTQDDRPRNTNSRVLRVEDVTSKSIKVRLETRFGSDPIVPQKIFFKNIQRNSDWKHYVVDEKRHRDENGSFVLTNLLCGNKYQIYGLFIDPETGHSVSSEVLITKTTGREPLAPPASVFLTRVNRTSYRLNLSGWSSGGCPILGASVQFRTMRQKHWTTLPVPSLVDPMTLSNLSPDQLYKVRVSMTNSAGETSVEYEIRSSDAKNVIQKNPAESPHLISLGNFHGPAMDMEGPSRFTDVLIISLTLLLTTLAAVAILYKTIQKKFTNSVDPRPTNRGNTVTPRVSKGSFVQNNMSGREMFAMQPAELSTVTLEKHFHVNKLSTSASDSGFNTCHLLNNCETQQRPQPAFQYLTMGRRGGGVDEYAVMQKSERETDVARYSAPICTPAQTVSQPPDQSLGPQEADASFCNECEVRGEEWFGNECTACGDKTPSALLSFRHHHHHQVIADRL